VIRPGTAADAAAIATIWNACIRDTTVTFLPDPKSNADVAAMLAQDTCLVWVEAGRVLGFARYFQFRGGRGYARTVEHTILFGPQDRQRGAGRALLEALCDHARGAGKHSIWAGVSAENHGGIAFHAALGFTEIARLPEVGFKFDRWIDLVLMQKRL